MNGLARQWIVDTINSAGVVKVKDIDGNVDGWKGPGFENGLLTYLIWTIVGRILEGYGPRRNWAVRSGLMIGRAGLWQVKYKRCSRI